MEAAQSLVTYVCDLKEFFRRIPKGLLKRENALDSDAVTFGGHGRQAQFTEYFEASSTYCDSGAAVIASSAKAA